MNARDISGALEQTACHPDSAFASSELVDQWTAQDVGEEAIEPILRFMETHPAIDYGTPGPLVHFVEKFPPDVRETELLRSLERRPTAHTAWMLHRVINGTAGTARRSALREALNRAKSHPKVDALAIELIDDLFSDPESDS